MAHYLIFGDSIGCGEGDPHGGWAKLLAEKYPVKNLSIDGATTDNYVKNFPTNIDKNSTLIIALGVNDSAKLPLTEFQQIIFVGPAPVNQVKVDPVPWAPKISYKNNLIKQFSAAICLIARKEKIKFIDLFNQLPPEYIKTLNDGFHPNHAGHEKIYKIVVKNIKMC